MKVKDKIKKLLDELDFFEEEIDKLCKIVKISTKDIPLNGKTRLLQRALETEQILNQEYEDE